MNTVPPGWNDPPPVPSSSQGSGISSKSRLLNKRIPFNFSNTNAPTSSNEIPRLSHLPEATQSEVVTSTTDINSENAETIDISQVTAKLKNLAANVQDTNKKIEILKRLDVMEKMWNNHEFNSQIQQQILDFATFLELENIKQANDIYLTLTLNSTFYCSSWIIAFKYLLHHFKE